VLGVYLLIPSGGTLKNSRKGVKLFQTITLRLKLHQPTRAKQAIYRDLTRRVTSLANNLVQAGRPRGLTSRTARPYCEELVPSAVFNQAIRDVSAHPHVVKFRVLWPSFNSQNCRLIKAGGFWTASFPTQAGRVRVPVAASARQDAMLALLGKTVKQGAAKLYKAALAGMKVEWVVPKNTSRACPVCGVIEISSRKGIVYTCVTCGHTAHADAVGALNIGNAISGLAAR